MQIIIFIIAIGLLSLSNGANDNFKGMASVWGSKTLSYRKSLLLANGSTLLGALTAVFFTKQLLKTFSGKGIIDDIILHQQHFGIALALGAALTVIIATKLRLPISTTHALIGALTGAGFYSLGTSINFSPLISKAFIPLLVSPLLAIILTTASWHSFKLAKKVLFLLPNCVVNFNLFL